MYDTEPLEIHIVTTTVTRLRPLLIGLVILLFTAGIAFAGKPSTPAAGLSVASEASDKVVPVKAEPAEEPGDEETETTHEGAGENCATDPTELTDEELAAMRHGSVVCWAAHQDTPEGYDNHGAWVSEWARKNHGQETAGAGTEAAAHGQAAGHGKGKSHQP